jgi:hypothetical protein
MTRFLQRDEGTREFIKWQFRQEKKKIQVQTSKGGFFFDWDKVGAVRNKGRYIHDLLFFELIH